MSECALHHRPSTTTCRRCGLFICDWCEKLAPSWGPGLCDGCRRHAAPNATRMRPLSKPTMIGLLLVLWVTLGAWGWLPQAGSWAERALRIVVGVGGVATIAAVLRTHRVRDSRAQKDAQRGP